MRRNEPALVAVACAATASVVYQLLTGSADPGPMGALGHWYGVWAAVATLSATAWIAVGLYGLGLLRRAPRPPAARLLALALLSVASTTFLQSVTADTVMTPDIGLRPYVTSLLVLAWLSVSPWVLIVWETLDRVVAIDQQVQGGTSADLPTAADALRTAWRDLERGTLAMGVLLSTIVLNTGALRLAFLRSKKATEEAFPAIYVLGYGAVSALVVGLLVVPLLLAWRSRALAWVDATAPWPTTAPPDAELVDTRIRAAASVGIDAHVLRNPLTVLSVLAPLGTALLGSLVPTA